MAGTLVSAFSGGIAIENIDIGDMVWAENPEIGEKALKEVVQVFEHEVFELVHVHVTEEVITATTEHPFYVPSKGWTSAIDLRAGDVLVLQSGEYVIVELVQHEILERPITVYNFEVEDFHTYYVSERGILVHNMCQISTSRGSTARRQPENLLEHLALEQVKSNPQGIKLPFDMTDARWPKEEGWIKMAQNIQTSKGKIEIHYVYNTKLKIYDDFKLK